MHCLGRYRARGRSSEANPVVFCEGCWMQPSTELGQLIGGYFRSFTVGDPGWVEHHVLNGDELRLIGTNANSTFDHVGQQINTTTP